MDLKETIAKFGSDVMESAERITKGAVDGSKKMAEKAKLQNTIRRTESKMNEIYIAMGKKCEEIYGSKNMPEFAGYMSEIADAKAQLAAAKAELDSLDTASVCPHCKKYVTENQKFCPYCGTKLIESVDAVVVDTDSQES